MNRWVLKITEGCFWFFAVCTMMIAQETLTDDAVLRMAKAGLSESVIITMVNQQPGNYSTRVDDLIALKQAGISDRVVAAMVAKRNGAANVNSAWPQPAAETAPNETLEIGIYYKKGNGWMDVLPEVVNWKTGGTIKNLASVGVVKKDINGSINGSMSRNSVRNPLEFMIITAEGVSITEYQLIRLRPNKDSREFRTVTGGIWNQQSGATRDLISFDGRKIAPRTYSVFLPDNLDSGEYGFLAPGAFSSSGNSQAQIGKMHTFRIFD